MTHGLQGFLQLQVMTYDFLSLARGTVVAACASTISVCFFSLVARTSIVWVVIALREWSARSDHGLASGAMHTVCANVRSGLAEVGAWARYGWSATHPRAAAHICLTLWRREKKIFLSIVLFACLFMDTPSSRSQDGFRSYDAAASVACRCMKPAEQNRFSVK